MDPLGASPRLCLTDEPAILPHIITEVAKQRLEDDILELEAATAPTLTDHRLHDAGVDACVGRVPLVPEARDVIDEDLLGKEAHALRDLDHVLPDRVELDPERRVLRTPQHRCRRRRLPGGDSGPCGKVRLPQAR